MTGRLFLVLELPPVIWDAAERTLSEADDEALAVYERLVRGLAAFAADLNAQGLHVGIGNPPRCCCGREWPCSENDPNRPPSG